MGVLRVQKATARTNGGFALVLALSSCRSVPELEAPRRVSASASEAPPPRLPLAVASVGVERAEVEQAPEARLPALRSEWLVQLTEGERNVFVAPPAGATAPRPIMVGVHGAGDRPDWSCGGWRLASQVSRFVVCPQGNAMTPQSFAWASSAVLSERVDAAVAAARARFEGYVDSGPMIFAGFSQGATLAEPFLRKNAARFPIVILAEGGYATARSPAFAAAFRGAGGRRVVLVCGTVACFRSAAGAKKVLEAAGLETLVVGDPRAGHNLNEQMQKALQAAWPDISAPLP